MRFARQIYVSFGAILKNSPSRRGFFSSDENIDDLMERYIDLLTLADQLTSQVLAPCGTMSEEDVEKCKKLTMCIHRAWRELGLSEKKIKLHAIMRHLIRDLKRFRGLFYHTEDFSERDHQDRKRHSNQVKCIRAYEDKQGHYKEQESVQKSKEVAEADANYEKNRRRTNIPRRNNNRRNEEDPQIRRGRVFNKTMELVQTDAPLKEWFVTKPLPIESKKKALAS